jgi:hypothetical protein
MTRTSWRNELAFPIVLAITVAVAFLPARRRVHWQSELADLARLPARPISALGVQIGELLRPPADPTAGLRDADVEQLLADREVLERLYRAEQQRALQLQRELEELQRIPVEIRGSAPRMQVATITSRNLNSSQGAVELRVKQAAEAYVIPGTVGVYASVHLMGRTVGWPSRRSVAFLPLVNEATPPFQARVFPEDRPDLPLSRAPRLFLEPTGDGRLVGYVPRSEVVHEGDVVRMDDERWVTAQMMVVGDVSAVRVHDDEPLRHRIEVRPRYDVQRIAQVTLIVPEAEFDDGAEIGGPGDGASPGLSGDVEP